MVEKILVRRAWVEPIVAPPSLATFEAMVHPYPRDRILAYVYFIPEAQQVVLKNAVSLKAAVVYW